MLHFGLIGRNISYSMSPEIHNQAFREQGIDAIYKLLDIPDLTHFRELMETLDGVNVTIPYKQAVMPLLDFISPEAEAIGAVNTIYKYEGQLMGDNTDSLGFIALWTEACAKAHITTSDRIAILGNGGAAKAVIRALDTFHYKHDTVTHAQMDSHTVDIDDYKVVINATPNHRPNIDYEGFKEGKCAIDLTYNPAETEFLREARQKGAITLNGMTMLLKQAECARHLWLNFLENLEV